MINRIARLSRSHATDLPIPTAFPVVFLPSFFCIDRLLNNRLTQPAAPRRAAAAAVVLCCVVCAGLSATCRSIYKINAIQIAAAGAVCVCVCACAYVCVCVCVPFDRLVPPHCLTVGKRIKNTPYPPPLTRLPLTCRQEAERPLKTDLVLENQPPGPHSPPTRLPPDRHRQKCCRLGGDRLPFHQLPVTDMALHVSLPAHQLLAPTSSRSNQWRTTATLSYRPVLTAPSLHLFHTTFPLFLQPFPSLPGPVGSMSSSQLQPFPSILFSRCICTRSHVNDKFSQNE